MKTVVITRPRRQAAPFAVALEQAGFRPVYFPVIHIRPLADLSALQEALRRLEAYDWVVFSSVNAVKIFLDAALPAHRGRLGTRPRVAAVGPKTAASLRERGVPVGFVPAQFSGEHILPGLGDLRGARVLLPRPRVASALLPREIRVAGGICDEIVLYETLPAQAAPDGLAALHAGVSAVTFTSPSTVQNFAALVRQAGLDPQHLPETPLFACIGPVTAAAARAIGLFPCCVAEQYTTEGLVAALLACKETR